MELKKPKYIHEGVSCDLVSFDEFRELKGLPNTSNAAIAYNLENDHIDYVILGRFRYIVYNAKARDFTIGIRKPKLSIV